MIVVVTKPERKIVAVTKLKIRIAVKVKEKSFYKEEWERRCQQGKHILKIVTSVIFIFWTPVFFSNLSCKTTTISLSQYATTTRLLYLTKGHQIAHGP